jgi:hypothetical protein
MKAAGSKANDNGQSLLPGIIEESQTDENEISWGS